jgi:RNA polymerase sigma factor (sigma-70 family)
MSDTPNRSTPPDATPRPAQTPTGGTHLVTTTGVAIVLNEPTRPARRRRSSPQAPEATVIVVPPPTPEVDRGDLIEQLCGKHSDYIRRTLLKQPGLNEESAKDLTQATLLAFAVEVAEHGSPDEERKYINGIMRNLLRARWRLRLRAPQIEDGADVDLEMDGARDPDAEAQLAERWAKLERYLAELPEGEREAFRRIELEGETIEHAAAAIGRPRSTVADRLARAYTKLRARVQESARGTQLAALLDPPQE